MKGSITWVGIDAHKKTLAVAVLHPAQTQPEEFTIANDERAAAALPLYREHIAWLRCFHGVDTIVAMIFVAELHGIERFESPRALAAYLGLVPSVHASGDMARRGSITKTGNGHIRRVLVQAAWQYSRNLALGAKVRARRAGQPERVLTIADEARRRLTTRYRRLVARGKAKNKVVIAIARELVGFFWAAMRADIEPARHGARTSARTERANASAAPRSSPRLKKAVSRAEVDQRRKARQDKRAVRLCDRE
jgi:hypothetical protein